MWCRITQWRNRKSWLALIYVVSRISSSATIILIRCAWLRNWCRWRLSTFNLVIIRMNCCNPKFNKTMGCWLGHRMITEIKFGIFLNFRSARVKLYYSGDQEVSGIIMFLWNDDDGKFNNRETSHWILEMVWIQAISKLNWNLCFSLFLASEHASNFIDMHLVGNWV